MSAAQAAAAWIRRLSAAGVPEAAVSVQYCLAKALGGRTLPVAEAAIARQALLSPSQLIAFETLCERRLRREPLQYLMADWDFDVLENIIVRPPVLVPRPETEQLVGLAAGVVSQLLDAGAPADNVVPRHLSNAMAPLQAQLNSGLRFLEVGCGSGAICLSMLKRFPALGGAAIDISQQAIDLSIENAVAQGITLGRFRVERCDFADYEPPVVSGVGAFHLLLSNPPYIPDQEIALLDPEVRDWEDHRALAGGTPHGLGLILKMLGTAAEKRWLVSGGLAILETDVTHPTMLAKLLKGGVAAKADDENDTLPIYPADELAAMSGRKGGCKTDENRSVSISETLSTLPRNDLNALQRFEGSDECAFLQRNWRMVSAHYDYQQRPRFVVLQFAPSLVGRH